MLLKTLHLLIGQNEEQLVGRAWHSLLEALVQESFTQADGHLICMSGQAEVEIVGHQRLELNAQETSFGQHTATLLDEIAEVFLQAGRLNDYSLAKERSLLRTAYVEDICKACQLWERYV